MTYSYNSVNELTEAVKAAGNNVDKDIIDLILSNKGTAGSEKYSSVNSGCTKILNGEKKLTEQYEMEAAHFQFAPMQSTGQYILQDEPVTGLFDVAEYCSNTGKEYWLNELEAPRQNKSLKVVVNIAAPHFTKQVEYFRKLIKIIAYIDAKEAAGTRCEIWTVLYCTNGINLEVKIKDQSEPINIGQMVYQMATPVLLRFAYFIISAQTLGSKFGRTQSDTDKEGRAAAHAMLDNSLYIPSFYIEPEYPKAQTIDKMYQSYFNHIQN